MFRHASGFGLCTMLAGITSALSAQTPVLRAHPFPDGRIGIQFPTSTSSPSTLLPWRPVELQFEVAPLTPGPVAPPSGPTRLKGDFGSTCTPPLDSLDQSGDSKMVLRGGSYGVPPVPMPGAGQICHGTVAAPPESP